MDQLKKILGVLKKHHFWLLAVICMICGMVGWMMASKSLSAAYVQKKANILKAFDGLKSIQGTENFPNATWKDEVAKLTTEQQKKVRQAWELVYNEQKQILKWPKEVLGDDFVDTVEKIPWGEEIPPGLRQRYAQLIKEEVPNLLNIIHASDPKSDASKEAATGPPGVAWAGASQLPNRLKWSVAPTAIEIWLAQEDLWVYSALLTIISKVNGEEYVPKIPRINSLLIGRDAADELERGMAPGHIDGPPQSGGAAGAGDAAQPAAPGGEPVEKAPDEGRYVDKDGKRVPPGTAPKAEFKRMPIFMKLTIDQRSINKLLVECANSALPVDVRYLRVNPSKASTSSGGGSSSDKAAKTGSTNTLGEGESFDVPIEVAGIIYIYNKPDTTKLGAEPAQGDAQPGAPAAPAAAAAGG
jgi:hypothetical protein